jgi:hypothetical protein
MKFYYIQAAKILTIKVIHGIYWWVSLATTDGDETAVIIVDVNYFHQCTNMPYRGCHQV